MGDSSLKLRVNPNGSVTETDRRGRALPIPYKPKLEQVSFKQVYREALESDLGYVAAKVHKHAQDIRAKIGSVYH